MGLEDDDGRGGKEAVALAADQQHGTRDLAPPSYPHPLYHPHPPIPGELEIHLAILRAANLTHHLFLSLSLCARTRSGTQSLQEVDVGDDQLEACPRHEVRKGHPRSQVCSQVYALRQGQAGPHFGKHSPLEEVGA